MSNASSHSEIHALAQLFAVRSGCNGVVLLTKDYKSAISHYPDSAVIFLLQTPKSSLSNGEIKELPANVAPLPLQNAGHEVLKNKVFVCVDYFEDSRYIFGLYGWRVISSVAEKCALSVVSVKKNRKWNITKLKKNLRLNKTALFGEYLGNELVAIGGRLTKLNRGHYPLVPALAIVSQFNEVDIIDPVVNHLLAQGIDVHVIDNWSDDGSYEAVEELVKANPDRVSIERFPKQDSHKYEWAKILERVAEVAKEKPRYKWIISNDADEIRWSPWPGISLQKAISFIDRLGFNIIDYTVFNFSPTAHGYQRGMDPLEFFRYGDFGHEGWHFTQLKTWKNDPKADIASSSGHLVKVPNPKIFPLKFFLGHYPLRSNAQASKKIFEDRKPRFLADERKRGWHSHYDKIGRRQDFICSEGELINHSKRMQFLENYLIERISGIGIKINEVNQG